MRLILDNNIFFSLFNPYSVNSYLFSLSNIKFCTPLSIKLEFEEHKPECLLKSKLSEHEFKIRQTEIEEKIEFFELSAYKKVLKKALNSLPDPDDSPYLALALTINAPIWSNDPHLKQQKLAKVYTTEGLIRELLRGVD